MDVGECRIWPRTFALVLGICGGARAGAQEAGDSTVRRLTLDDALRAAEAKYAATVQTAIPTPSAQPSSSATTTRSAAQTQGVPGQTAIPRQTGAGTAGAGTPMRSRRGVP
jgi:hypothetical protein